MRIRLYSLIIFVYRGATSKSKLQIFNRIIHKYTLFYTCPKNIQMFLYTVPAKPDYRYNTSLKSYYSTHLIKMVGMITRFYFKVCQNRSNKTGTFFNSYITLLCLQFWWNSLGYYIICLESILFDKRAAQ